MYAYIYIISYLVLLGRHSKWLHYCMFSVGQVHGEALGRNEEVYSCRVWYAGHSNACRKRVLWHSSWFRGAIWIEEGAGQPARRHSKWWIFVAFAMVFDVLSHLCHPPLDQSQERKEWLDKQCLPLKGRTKSLQLSYLQHIFCSAEYGSLPAINPRRLA